MSEEFCVLPSPHYYRQCEQMQAKRVLCSHAARRCCFAVVTVVVAVAVFLVVAPLESAYLYRGSMCFGQRDLSLVEDSACILQQSSPSASGHGKYYSQSNSKEGKDFRGEEEADMLCQPLPHPFPLNASLFPCDWDTRTLHCRRRLKAEVTDCQQGSARLTLRSVPSNTPPASLPFKDQCLDDVIRRSCYEGGVSVPRVVHYVHLGQREFPFYAWVSAVSAVKFLGACLLLVHGDSLPHGHYWDLLMQLVPRVVHVRRDPPTSIFNNTVKVVEHQADVVRLEALIHYGGLYLDFDVWILNSLDEFLSMDEVIIGRESPNGGMCNGMIIAKRDASFLHRWYAAYQTFQDEQWAQHSGRVPFTLSTLYRAETRVVNTFFRPDLQNVLCTAFKGRYQWTADHAIHLWRQDVRHIVRERHQRAANSIGEILRHILFGSQSNCYRGKCHVPVVRARP